MNKTLRLILFLMLLSNFKVNGQSIVDFEKDFEEVAVGGFQKDMVESLISKVVPDAHLIQSRLYQDNINMLLADTAQYKNQLGYLLIASSGDETRLPLIEAKLKQNGYMDFWGASAMMSFPVKNFEPILKTIANLSNTPVGSYLIQMFLNQESGSLEAFATDSIKSKNIFTRYLAIRSLNNGPMSVTKRKLLRDIIVSQDSLKGWAISVLAEHNETNLSKLLRPYLNNDNLRSVTLRALANSSSAADLSIIDSLIKVNPVEETLMEALKSSQNTASQKKWLTILRTQLIPDTYFPNVDHTKILENDAIFDEMVLMMKNTPNRKRIVLLYAYFLKRTDERTTLFLLDQACQPDIDQMSLTRIVGILQGRESKLIKDRLPDLMKNATVERLPLLNLLLKYKNYDYKSTVSQWLDQNTLDSMSRELCEKYIGSVSE